MTAGTWAALGCLALFLAIDGALYLTTGQTLSRQLYLWSLAYPWVPGAFLGGVLALTALLYVHFFGPRKPW